MRRKLIYPLLLAATVSLAAATLGTTALAAEGRPWLCRDKPVFSSNRPVHFNLVKRGAQRWRMFFMQFDPSGGHDGFTVQSTYDLTAGAPVSGELEAGRYFAVALYLASGGRWICPGPAQDAASGYTPGQVANLCYGEEGAGCSVHLTVMKQAK